MKSKRLSFLICIVLCYCTATSQDIYYFKKGLIARTPSRYGREAIYMDPLAYNLYMQNLTTPTEGAVFSTNTSGANITWQAMTADSANNLRGPGRGQGFGGGMGSYIYLTYTSPAARVALLNIKGGNGVYVNGEPHMSDPYSSGFLYIPVHLKKGLNEFYVRGGMANARLEFPSKQVTLNKEDPTVPLVVLGVQQGNLQAAIVVINAGDKELRGYSIRSVMEGKEITSALPAIPAMSTRKVPFTFNSDGVTKTGNVSCSVTLLNNGKEIDALTLPIEAVDQRSKYSTTFTSSIDGSLQYYAVAPQLDYKPGSAFFLSVHGAGVEAIGQARAYQSKDWGTLVAPTNRRPRGFNWEDWGRLDALEVFEQAKARFKPDPQHIYLTGHSMGGHGTWFLGATYPDKWAAIAPCAGYPTLKGYGSADGLIPDSASSPIEQILLRSGNQSDVIKLVSNYKPLGVYVFHGDADRTVSVNYARQMKKLLADYHADLTYYEYPGGEHWFGNESVDWKPIFDYFRWHKLALDSAVNQIDFKTSNPGISASFRWASIQQQNFPLQLSRLLLSRNRGTHTISGTTENVRSLKLNLQDFAGNSGVRIVLDGQTIDVKNGSDTVFLTRTNESWQVGEKPTADQKNPVRYGTFKDAFNHNMVFVYGTKGTKEENEWSISKARFDAETWYYRGNGAVDIIADKDFSLEKYKDRGVILFGNKQTNAAWNMVLADCPIQVERNRIVVGDKQFTGDDLATYYVWPIKGSAVASVGVISGTGIKGMKAAYANQYFAGASGFPDFMIFSLGMLQSGVSEVKLAGFFDNNWKLDNNNLVEK